MNVPILEPMWLKTVEQVLLVWRQNHVVRISFLATTISSRFKAFSVADIARRLE
jgi:hypothetical protein